MWEFEYSSSSFLANYSKKYYWFGEDNVMLVTIKINAKGTFKKAYD